MPGISRSGNMIPQSRSMMRPVDLDAGAVAPDLAEAAQEDQPDGISQGGPTRYGAG